MKQKFKGKTFDGNRPLAEIIANARQQGVAVDDYNYRVLGHDNIAFGIATGKRPDNTDLVTCRESDRGWVFYNSFNGRFFGRTDKGVAFDSSSTRHEHEPWFQALLSFFYVEKQESVFKAVEKFIDGTQVIRDAGGKKKATMTVKRIPGGANVTLKAAKGVDLRGVLPAILGERKPERAPTTSPPPRDRHRPGDQYLVDSSDGGAY